jgi:hypothetical protein
MTRTREHGRFVFALNNITGTVNLFLCPGQDHLKEAGIRINTDFSSDYPEQLCSSPTLDSTWRGTLEEMWINAQVASVFNRDNNRGTIKPINRNIFGESLITVRLADYIELASLYEVFYEIVPYVQIKKKKDQYKLLVVNDRLEVFENPLILLDNVPVYDVDELMKIAPALVERIEVINKTYIHGDFVLNRVIMIFTRTENYAGIKFPEGSVFLEYQTCQSRTEFHAPENDPAGAYDKYLPDFRNLLYWDPEVTLHGKTASVTFYTSDSRGTYEITVRGFTSDGVPCFGKGSFEVNP